MRHKPKWIRTTWQQTPEAKRIRRILWQQKLNTVCEESSCPNRGECYNRGICTFLILGTVCTRDCRFCDVAHGHPLPPDPTEPQRVAKSTRLLGVRYIVITSVDRDDLSDFGSGHFAETIRRVRLHVPDVAIEVLTPDFQADRGAVRTVLEAGPDIFAHNVETVRRLTPLIRDRRASYERSLEVLAAAHEMRPDIPVKSGLMVGLGETDEEVIETLVDLHRHDAGSITIGQYLAPTARHLPVDRFVEPRTFEFYAERAHELGFRHVASGPMVRSSYRADEMALTLENPDEHR